MLAIGKSLVNDAGLNRQIILRKGDAQYLDFENKSFDVVINAFMLHIVGRPVSMLDEIERVARPGAKIMITDLRRGLLTIISPKLRKAFAMKEALGILGQSGLRQGKPSTGPFWWDYMAGI